MCVINFFKTFWNSEYIFKRKIKHDKTQQFFDKFQPDPALPLDAKGGFDPTLKFSNPKPQKILKVKFLLENPRVWRGRNFLGRRRTWKRKSLFDKFLAFLVSFSNQISDIFSRLEIFFKNCVGEILFWYFWLNDKNGRCVIMSGYF